MTGLAVLLLSPGVPLVLAFALMVRPRSRALKIAGAWSALPALATSWLMAPGIAATVPWILQGSEFGLDGTGRVFLFLSAALWLVAGLVARSWIVERDSRFLINLLLVMSGSLGLVVARDMLAFYLFFTLMSFASYALVVHDRSQRSRHAGRIFITFVLAGDMMIFAALVLIAQEAGGELLFEATRAGLPNATNRHAALALLMLGFGVKVGLLGVHVTLPLIYQAAPVPAGVALAGAMINAGLLGWLRLLPTGSGGMHGWGRAFIVAGVAAAFYGALVGLLQRRPRVVLAYSSISQMGIMTMGVGVALAALDAEGVLLAAVALYALHHAFAKGALFLGSGIAERAAGRHRVWIALGLLLPALALAGAPLTTGMLAKETLKEALSVAGPEPWMPALKALLPWMAFATTLVLARFLWLVWAERPARRPVGTVPAAAWAVLIGLSLTAAWLMPRPVTPELWSASAFWEVSWPVLLGVLVSAVAALAAVRARLPRMPALPPGDVLALMAVLGSAFVRAWSRLARSQAPALRDALARAAGRVAGRPGWSHAAAAVERWLVDWRNATLLFLLMVLGIWSLLLLSR
jgi:formate hydrogenlyase subunit 3/multisubunit Na+/H+ antiporter MnhD subunit